MIEKSNIQKPLSRLARKLQKSEGLKYIKAFRLAEETKRVEREQNVTFNTALKIAKASMNVKEQVETRLSEPK